MAPLGVNKPLKSSIEYDRILSVIARIMEKIDCRTSLVRRQVFTKNSIMARDPRLENDVRAFRERAGWSQDELARKAGVSRAGISAIETGALVPSTGSALALARAFGCTVEDLFRLPGGKQSTDKDESRWAWLPTQSESRYWRAEMAGYCLAYPVEISPLGLLPHDGTVQNGVFHAHPRAAPAQTLVIACCDPAVGLLAAELGRAADVRLIVLQRSSQAALELLSLGLIHAAGVHLAPSDRPDDNRTAARKHLRAGSYYRLLRVADWDEGIAFAPELQFKTIREVVNSSVHWVSREPGSGARKCLDDVMGNKRKQPIAGGLRFAFNHRGVADAIRGGWAEAGICLRLTSLEANLNYLNVRREAYDLCFPVELAQDPRIQALIRAVRSSTYRRLIGELPGYDSTLTGEMQRIG
jgi:molybdate-binding protein/DNA-binding XRE family transcriptional regulator